MKKLISNGACLLAAMILITACKKDMPIVTLDTTSATSPKLTATESEIALIEARQNNTAIIFNWTKAHFNFDGSFKYTLQFAKAGTNFASPVNDAAGTDLTKAYTEKAFNNIVLSLGIPAKTEGNVEVRLKSVLSDSVAPIYSNIQNIAVTPYPIDQFLYVPGDYQGWDPSKAEIIRSAAKNDQYEGYVYFAGGTGEFKFTDAPDWNHGIFGEGTPGTITSPGNNFKVTPPGYYQLKANLKNNTWSSTKTSWSIIGDATPGTAWATDVDLAYDATTKTYKATVDLTAASIKFRANHDWGINFGDTGADGTLEYNGSNISVPSAGNYTVTLDLHGGEGKYTYSLKKN